MIAKFLEVEGRPMDPECVGRRTILQSVATAAGLAALPASSWVAALSAPAPTVSIDVLLDEPIGVIRPAVYGQFAEHIGGVIYDGIWVGTDSKIANIGGIRKALVEHVRRLGPVVVRWPGGCF